MRLAAPLKAGEQRSKRVRVGLDDACDFLRAGEGTPQRGAHLRTLPCALGVFAPVLRLHLFHALLVIGLERNPAARRLVPYDLGGTAQ